MILDKEMQMSDGQAITVDAASTNIIDLGAAGDANKELFLTVRSKAAAGDGTSMIISVETATDAAFTSPVVLIASPVILKAAMTADTVIWEIRLPRGLLRFVRLDYDITVTFTLLTVDANITMDLQANDLGSEG